MNESIPETIFSAIPMAPRDPILGITEAFHADPNPHKINLGVGVYYDDNGKVPLLKCVLEAERQMTAQGSPHTYLPIDGLAMYDSAVQKLVFGEDNIALQEKRVATVQSIGGTGALKIGADFLKRFSSNSQVWISDPSWENHRALFEAAGFKVNTYPYYDSVNRGVDFAGMISTLKSLPARSVVVLHACCHNPTGAGFLRRHRFGWQNRPTLCPTVFTGSRLEFLFQIVFPVRRTCWCLLHRHRKCR